MYQKFRNCLGQKCLIGSLPSLLISLLPSLSFRSVLALLQFRLLLGLVPLLYLATGIEDSISSITRISGKYRVVEARARDFVIRFDVLVAEERRRLYQEMQDQLLQLKEEAHTIPRWAFISAERLIKQKEYSPVTISMRGGSR